MRLGMYCKQMLPTCCGPKRSDFHAPINGQPYATELEAAALLLVRVAIGFGVASTANPVECDDAAVDALADAAAGGLRFQIARSCTVRLLGWHKRSSSTVGRTLPTTTGSVTPNSERTRSETCICPLLHPVLSNALLPGFSLLNA